MDALDAFYELDTRTQLEILENDLSRVEDDLFWLFVIAVALGVVLLMSSGVF